MIILDTNVVSEVMKPSPSRAVVDWLAVQNPAIVFITAITEAELRYGLELLPKGKRRDTLLEAMSRMLAAGFESRVLPFDSSAARRFGEISAARRRRGRPISQSDAHIASIARSRQASIATRDVDGFQLCGVPLIDPWRPSHR
jgi:toxin FitB